MVKLSFLFLFVTLSLASSATDYEDAWTAINKNDFKTAKKLLHKAIQNQPAGLDAYFTLIYINSYEGREDKLEGFQERLNSSPDKNSYLFPFWFNGSVLGNYGRKKPHQEELLNYIFNNKSYNGSIQSAAHYVKGMDFVSSNEYGNAMKEWDKMGAIEDWQLAGPFENLSGSSFNQKYGPERNPDNKARFKGINNIDVNWFTPAVLNRQGWTATHMAIPVSSAIVYAQTFVYSKEKMKVMLNVGGSGSLKVWVNDRLVISESKERKTELDCYKNYCQLNKGYNRIVVQLGYSDNSYPNFIVRLTDDEFIPVSGLTYSVQNQPYEKNTEVGTIPSTVHFAEDYFIKKINSDPSNLINYILLSEVYLRNDKASEARTVIEKGLKLQPDNILLRFELMQCLLKAENNTLLLTEIEWLKEKDPSSYIVHQIKTKNLINEEKYTEANEELSKMVNEYGEDEISLDLQTTILSKTERIDDLVKVIKNANAKFPLNTTFLTMMFNIEKVINKDSKGALAIYERFIEKNYSYNILTNLGEEYKNQGLNNKYLQLLEKEYKDLKFDPDQINLLTGYYFQKRDYTKALEYAKEVLSIAPFSGKYWYNKGNIEDQMNSKEAIKSFKNAIYYDRTNYDARKRLNELENKPDLYKLLGEPDVYQLIKNSVDSTDYDFSYLVDQHGSIIYEEGASEQYVTYVVKLNTQKGIDSWKDISLPYNSNTQSLLIEKSEAIKKNGSKVPAERADNRVVFTNLEPGDAIYVKYKLQSYAKGRIGKEFSDKFILNSFVPSASASYRMIVPEGFKFQYNVLNEKLVPTITREGGYEIYTWEMHNIVPIKYEPLMPALNDIGISLHISTTKDWSEIANWYADISYEDLSDNLELNQVYSDIFKNHKPKNQFEKAKLIYQYIINNIGYSSISFRQSGIIPQAVSKIITTRLGDCKDLSTLFVALARKADINAQLVLVDTRDNGIKDMALPSMDFNHCIAKANLDGKEMYIELTDRNLPFCSIPNNDIGSIILTVPLNTEKTQSELGLLNPVNRTAEKSIRNINVVLKGKDLQMNVVAKKYGSLTSYYRDEYATISIEKKKEKYLQLISKDYKNPVTLENISFKGLNDKEDSVVIEYTYNVKNEIIEAGSMKMVKVPFIDVIATLENFTSEKRTYPIEYWTYENTDEYVSTVTLQLPAGQKIVDMPKDEVLNFKENSYIIKYTKEGNKLKATRVVKLKRKNISPEDYTAFRKFFNDIVEAESKYIVFK